LPSAIPRVDLAKTAKDRILRKLLSMLLGLNIGAVVGAILVLFFSPFTSAELRENWQTHYQRALIAGRKASAERRAELEKELSDLRET
jgi:gas vesicle protein